MNEKKRKKKNNETKWNEFLVHRQNPESVDQKQFAFMYFFFIRIKTFFVFLLLHFFMFS